MKDEHDLVMTDEQEREWKQSITDQVDDAMLFDYDQVLDTIANSERCEKAIMNLCMLPPKEQEYEYEDSSRAIYADDLINAIADDMRSRFE